MNRKKFFEIGFIMFLAIFQSACSLVGIHSEENPKYEVLQTEGDLEVRAYAPYVVAKTTVTGEFKEAQSKAFRILAGYIFGGNEKQPIAMTAPVVIEGVSKQSEKVAMTAPVMQTATEQGWQMAFMMPSKYKITDLPTPKDNRVQFEEIPAKTYGVVRYSGVGKENVNNNKASELKNWIIKNNLYEIIGNPKYAGYNPPWTIPFFRRNEVMYEVKIKK